ncbi:dipeptidase [Ferrovibrio sp.]|uniref:dipeptidase n=1 Tax=Ferrovibrio sp. TaxID=1917215 RepID=UPI003D09A340
MRIGWEDIRAGRTEGLHGTWVELEGWCLGLDGPERSDYFALTDEPGCCAAHLPRDPARRVEVLAALPLRLDMPRLRLRGEWRRLPGDDPDDWRFQLRQASPVADPLEAAPHPGFTRRAMLAGGGALLGLSAWRPEAAQAAAPALPATEMRALLTALPTIDIHSHGGSLIGLRRTEEAAPFSPLAEPMREGGMAVVCLTVVADTPVTRVANGQIKPFRDPKPGELYGFATKSFPRAQALAKAQGLKIITTASELAATRPDNPGVIIASEGADFLEGRLERLDEAYTRWQLRHLQLTHYRPNELGDIQTEPAVHGGLTAFGADVVKRCNQLGIVVDVAHAPMNMVRQVADITAKPLVLSHTSMTIKPGPTSRQISREHARFIAATRGVIGIWPPSGIYATMAELATGIARVAELIGVDYVGIGTDMMGLVGASTFDSYTELPNLANALLGIGFKPADVQKILGGNYARVFAATVGG